MIEFFWFFFSWLPLPLAVIACGVVSLFFLFTALHLIRFILELIPFL